MTSKGFTICLWFDTEGEDAANFYTSIFKDSRIGSVSRYPEGTPGQAGSVMTVDFEMNGQSFLALNGGPQYTFNEAVSLTVYCQDQDEVDYYWDRLTEGGGQGVACGWLKDKFGLFWQVVPTAMAEMASDPDREKAGRAMAAMMKMTKFDIAELRRAFNGE